MQLFLKRIKFTGYATLKEQLTLRQSQWTDRWKWEPAFNRGASPTTRTIQLSSDSSVQAEMLGQHKNSCHTFGSWQKAVAVLLHIMPELSPEGTTTTERGTTTATPRRTSFDHPSEPLKNLVR